MAVWRGRPKIVELLINKLLSWLIGSGRLGTASQRCRNNGLGFFLDLSQMVLTEETIGVNLVEFLRARRTCCKPTILGNHFDSSNRIAVSRSGGQNLLDQLR